MMHPSRDHAGLPAGGQCTLVTLTPVFEAYGRRSMFGAQQKTHADPRLCEQFNIARVPQVT
jgi:hypothetical protein